MYHAVTGRTPRTITGIANMAATATPVSFLLLSTVTVK
jgi:hypothetical protein